MNYGVLQVVRPVAGGMKRHVHSLVRGLMKAGYRVSVASAGGAFAAELQAAGLAVTEIPLRGTPHPIDDFICIKRISQLLKKQKIDILHAHGYRAGWVGRVAAKLARTPVVIYTVHSSVLHNPWPRWWARLFLRFDGYFGCLTDRIIAVSNDLRQELVAYGRVPAHLVKTIYNGVEYRDNLNTLARHRIRAALGVSEGALLVGTVARLAPQKGVSVFLRATALIKEEHDDARFVVVGDGPLRRTLEEEAKSLALPVTFTGFRNDVPEILKALDVFVLPSLTEGLPYVVLEAMACGLPVVATRAGGVPEVIQDGKTGILVAPGSEKELARGLAMLLRDGSLRRQLGTAARSHVLENFSEEKMLRETLSLYTQLIEAKVNKQCAQRIAI